MLRKPTQKFNIRLHTSLRTDDLIMGGRLYDWRLHTSSLTLFLMKHRLITGNVKSNSQTSIPGDDRVCCIITHQQIKFQKIDLSIRKVNPMVFELLYNRLLFNETKTRKKCQSLLFMLIIRR